MGQFDTQLVIEALAKGRGERGEGGETTCLLLDPLEDRLQTWRKRVGNHLAETDASTVAEKALAGRSFRGQASTMENHRLALPEHMNQYGFLFGGYLLAWVDEMAWMAASRDYPGCQLVTVGMKEVVFKKSVRDGTILRFEALRTQIGDTSVSYSVTV